MHCRSKVWEKMCGPQNPVAAEATAVQDPGAGEALDAAGRRVHCRNPALKKPLTQEPMEWNTLQSGKKDPLPPPLSLSPKLPIDKA